MESLLYRKPPVWRKTLPCVKAFENEFNIRDFLKKAKEKNEP